MSIPFVQLRLCSPCCFNSRSDAVFETLLGRQHILTHVICRHFSSFVNALMFLAPKGRCKSPDDLGCFVVLTDKHDSGASQGKICLYSFYSALLKSLRWFFILRLCDGAVPVLWALCVAWTYGSRCLDVLGSCTKMRAMGGWRSSQWTSTIPAQTHSSHIMPKGAFQHVLPFCILLRSYVGWDPFQPAAQPFFLPIERQERFHTWDSTLCSRW